MSGLQQQPAPKPQLPRINLNACPFECCQFGEWKAGSPVAVYADWHAPHRQIFQIAKGQTVTAVTGVHITNAPGQVRALKSDAQLGVKPGDIVLTYMNKGEGSVDYWVNGHEGTDELLGPDCSDKAATRGQAFCVVKAARAEWWVQIKDKKGKTGWIQGNKGFTGSDACE